MIYRVTCKSDNVQKAIVFAGDQFTYGQGLHYYSNLPTIETPQPWTSNFDDLTDTHKKFIEKYRFARLVADHFNTVEIVRTQNYATNDLIIDYFDSAFKNKSQSYIENHNPPYIKYDEVCIIFFQMTKIDRDNVTITIEENIITEPLHLIVSKYKSTLEKTLDFDEWYNQQISLGLQRVKHFLQTCENNGIKVILATWDHDNVSLIKNNEYLNSKFMTFTYNNKIYDSWMELIPDPKFTECPANSELLLTHDFDNFLVTPKDIHFSKLGHKVIADNIITYIEDKKWL